MTDEITLDAPETRLERFLAAAAGVDGIPLDEPETRIERYLYTLAQNVGAAEYWIPVLYDGSYFSIPDTAQEEIESKLNDPIHNLIRGISLFDGPTFVVGLPGYVSANEIIVPVSKSAMVGLGYDDEGRIRISKLSDEDEYRVFVEPNKFIVTLTPTAEDFSGMMDKTGEEITAAYESGQEIVLQIDYQNLLYTIDVSYVRDGRPSNTFITFVALFTLNGNLVQISTQQDTYDTDVFTLTPAT